MSGTISGNRETGSTTRPEALGAAKQLEQYLKGLDTSVVDNTIANLGQNANALSNNLPNYVYGVDGSYQAQQETQNAMYNQAANNLNTQYANDTDVMNTKLQNQGLAVGSNAYNNAMEGLQNAHYTGLDNAYYNSVMQGQQAFTNSLNNQIVAGNFTNNARQLSLKEILDALHNSVSGYQVQNDIFNAYNQASGEKNRESGINGEANVDLHKYFGLNTPAK